jgi:hypothetical protein
MVSAALADLLLAFAPVNFTGLLRLTERMIHPHPAKPLLLQAIVSDVKILTGLDDFIEFAIRGRIQTNGAQHFSNCFQDELRGSDLDLTAGLINQLMLFQMLNWFRYRGAG